MRGRIVTGVVLVLGLVACACVALSLWRAADRRADRAEAARLIAGQPVGPGVFDPAMVADLPEPARRFFLFALDPGVPLKSVVALEMTGKFGMGDKARPGYMDMVASQVLSAREGFVWSMSAGRWPMRLSGSDSGRWTRFWIDGLVPVARFGGGPDHARSAFGRHAAEAVFWAPTAVLPGPGITWQPVDETTARVTIAMGDLQQAVDLSVDDDGRPLRVAFDRWSDANPEKEWRLQRFGGYLSNHRDFGGVRIPTHVEAGNLFGSTEYFPFFVVDLTAWRFPDPGETLP